MKKYILASGIVMMAMSIVSCNDDPDNTIDDFPLNYKITEVKATQNIAVGCMLVDPYNDFKSNATRWDRLTEEYDPNNGKIGPYVRPAASPDAMYAIMGSAEEEQDDHARQIGRIVEEMKKARIDFVITPALRETKALYPQNINRDDSIFLNIISGRNKELAWSNDGSMKFALQVNMQNFASANGFASYSSVMEDRPDDTYTQNGQTITLTKKERFLSYIKSLARYMAEPTYYRLDDGRPVLYLRECDKFYVRDVKGLFDGIRETVEEVCGANPYIICSMPEWTIAPRYKYMVLDGEPDGLSPLNMAYYGSGSGKFELLYMWDILHNENFKYNVAYLQANNPATTFIPSVSNGYCRYILEGTYNLFGDTPGEEGMRKRCWLAKMNMGNIPLVIFDSYNDWARGNFIEPTDPEYGNGVGELYLDILREEFKID